MVFTCRQKMSFNHGYHSSINNRTGPYNYMPLPDANPAITDYYGPYPLAELQVTRTSLMQSLNGRFSLDLRHKLGLTPDGRRFVKSSHKNLDQVSFDSNWNISQFVWNEPIQDVESPQTSGSKQLTGSSVDEAIVVDECHNQKISSQSFDTRRVIITEDSAGKLKNEQKSSDSMYRDGMKTSPTIKIDSEVGNSLHPVDANNVEKKSLVMEYNENDARNLLVLNRKRLKYSDIDKPESTAFCFKCDTCDLISGANQRNDMMCHLQSNGHFSASYCLTDEKDFLTPLSILKPMQIVIPNKMKIDRTVSSLFVMCPVCFAVFRSSLFCACHIKCVHKIPVPKDYGQSNVIRRLTVMMTRDTTCQVCKKKHESLTKLHHHWKSANHYPFPLVKKNEKLICFCPYCMKMGYDTIQMKEHASNCNHMKTNFALNLVYLETTLSKRTFLPYPDSMTAEEKMKWDMHVLSQYKSREKGENVSKSSARLVRKTIKQMSSDSGKG